MPAVDTGNTAWMLLCAALVGRVAGAGGTPEVAVAAFQLTFAVIAVALISGSVADRMRFYAWLAVTVIWVTLAYFPLAHMVWGDGLLSASGPVAGVAAPLDFAGGTVCTSTPRWPAWCWHFCWADGPVGTTRSLITGLVVRAAIGLRAPAHHETVGLDVAVHGGLAYDHRADDHLPVPAAS